MNVVKRGAGRPGHTARTNRHAQRTPLPPKGTEIEDARAVIAETTPPRKRTGKVASVASPAPDARREADLKAMGEKAPQTKSWGKAIAFRDAVAALGWSASVGNPQDGAEIDLVEVTAQRGEEYLYISWVAGALQHPVTYTINDRTIKMRNASQAKQYAARSAEEATKEFSKAVSNRAFRRKEPSEKPGVRALPFDPGLATDEEVVTALLGKTVAWVNRISNGVEHATLGRDVKRVRVTVGEDGERQVLFCCPSTGFRAFRISQLVRVGGGKRYVVRDRDGNRIEREELPEEVSADA